MKTEPAFVTTDSASQSPVALAEKGGEFRAAPRIVTTSWDDGDPWDLRVAKLLARRHLPGTFYIPVNSHVEAGHHSSPMSRASMLELADQGFEIGAHGVSQSNLAACNGKELKNEVESSKKRLEDVLGKTVSMFAYPRGRHNGSVIAVVKGAGFSGARTTAMLGHELYFDPFRMPTSVQVYPHKRIDYFRNLARGWDTRRTLAWATHLRCARTWVELSKTLFDSVQRRGGIWHLYGHSWEIDEFKLWDELAEVLDYVTNRPGITYLCNGEAVQMRISRIPYGSCTPQAVTE